MKFDDRVVFTIVVAAIYLTATFVLKLFNLI